MSNLQIRQKKIQAKRKTTPWRDFVMEIASWYPVNFYRNNGIISKYSPLQSRIQNIIQSTEYEIERNKNYNKG